MRKFVAKFPATCREPLKKRAPGRPTNRVAQNTGVIQRYERGAPGKCPRILVIGMFLNKKNPETRYIESGLTDPQQTTQRPITDVWGPYIQTYYGYDVCLIVFLPLHCFQKKTVSKITRNLGFFHLKICQDWGTFLVHRAL